MLSWIPVPNRYRYIWARVIDSSFAIGDKLQQLAKNTQHCFAKIGESAITSHHLSKLILYWVSTASECSQSDTEASGATYYVQRKLLPQFLWFVTLYHPVTTSKVHANPLMVNSLSYVQRLQWGAGLTSSSQPVAVQRLQWGRSILAAVTVSECPCRPDKLWSVTL